jgi:predicted ferric reductase
MNYFLKGIFWTAVYLALVLTPLFILLIAPTPPGGGWRWDFSIALGFAGTAMMGVMFFLTARFRRASAPFGIDIIYFFHRQIAIWIFFLILAHPLLILWAEPSLIRLMVPGVMPAYVLAGVMSLLALAILVASSVWRKQLGIHYDGWRLWHAILAVAALALALIHMVGSAHYIHAPWTRLLWLVIAASCIALLLYIRLVKPAMMLNRPYLVERAIEERGDAWTLVVRPDGHSGFSFQPGQFAWLTLWSSPFALKEHPFSFSSSAARPDELRFTIKQLGDFTNRIGTVRPGERVYLDAPHGSFSIDRHDAPGYVFLAGGIGIAPIMSMLRTLADRQDRRPLLLFYAYSTWERMTFREEIESLSDVLNLRTVFVLAQPPSEWQGEIGFIDAEMLARHLPDDPLSREYFVCGPVPMISACEKFLHQLGVPLAKVRSELFDLV